MKKLLLLLLLLPLVIWADNDKYRLVLTDDPATTITIAWNQISGDNPVVKYGTEDFGKNAGSYPLSHGVDRETSSKDMNNKFARLTGLLPNTAYYFVIKDSKGVSERFWFKTATNDRSKLSFIAGGDSRNNHDIRRLANSLVAKLKPNAVLFGGDMTAGDTAGEWKVWLDDWQLTTASDGRMFPIVPTRGNHERDSKVIYDLFDTKHEDSYGAITFGDNFFRAYTLNTEISKFGNQRDWLESDLKKQSTQNALYRIAQYHKPMRPHTDGKTEGQDVYEAWAGLFYEYAVKMVVDCDSHIAKVTLPIKPSSGSKSEAGFEIDMDRGTTYVGEGSWGAPLRPDNDRKSWTRDAKSFNQFKWFFVSEDKIESRTIGVDNANDVGEVTNEQPFLPPANLDIWEMKDGTSVVEILPTQKVAIPKIEFASTVQTKFDRHDKISAEVNVVDVANGIEKVVFTAINQKGKVFELGTTKSTPYKIEDAQLPKGGIYKLSAMVYGIDGATSTITKEIFVGVYSNEIVVLLSAVEDDVEEGQGNGGKMYLNSSDLEFGHDDANSQNYQKIGLRYKNIEIPKGATIIAAQLEFYSKTESSEDAQTTIYLEDNAQASVFTKTDNNLSDRNYYPESVVWDMKPWSKKGYGPECYSPNLIALLDKVVKKDNWKSGDNSIVFKFEPTGPSATGTSNKRVGYSFDEVGGDAAWLRINYKSVPEGTPEIKFASAMKTGFDKKDNISVAVDVVEPGAGIEKVVFKAINDAGVEFPLGESTSNTYSLDNLTLPKDGTYKVVATAYPVQGALWVIEKDITVGAYSTELVVLLSSGNDDIEEGQGNGGKMYFGSSDLELGYDDHVDQKYQKVGLRYNNLNIPKGAKITSAKIEFYSKKDNAEDAQTTIYLEDNTKASAFTSDNNNLSDRVCFNEGVVWDIAPWVKKGEGPEYQTPSLAGLLDKLVKKDTWVAGDNSIVFKLVPTGISATGENNKREPYSFDGKGERANKLIITYDYDPANTAAIEDVIKKGTAELSCYPNPTNGKVSVLHAKYFDLSGVYDITGKKLNVVYNKKTNSLSLHNLSSGVYFLRFVNERTKKSVTRKIIKN